MSEVEQGSEAWFQQRCGKATASRISDIVAKTKQATAQAELTTWHSW